MRERMEKAKKVCYVSGFFQLAAGISFLFLTVFLRTTANYLTEYVRGWQLIAGYVAKTDVMKLVEETMGISMLLLFLCGSVLVLVCAAGAVTSWIPVVPPLVPAVCSVAGIAAVTTLYVYTNGSISGTDVHFGRFMFAAPCCLAAAAVTGFVSVGMRSSGKKKAVPVPAVHEKLPGLSEKIENKKYYQVVEKEPAAAQEGQPAAPYTPGSAPRGVMVGLAGVYAGVEIPFGPGETIRVGRDAASNLIFDKRAPRVSRHHCEITWNPGSGNYSIVDTSTNGTFKNGSEDCLPQNMNIVLEAGCTISLGSDDNMFRLE